MDFAAVMHGRRDGGTPWLRGPARIEGEWVVLDRERAEEYEPDDADDALTDLGAIDRPDQVIAFVRKHGLLKQGPDAADHREPLSDWWASANQVFNTLQLAARLRKAIAGDRDALEYLETTWHPLYYGEDWPAGYDRREILLARMGYAVAQRVSAGLAGVEEQIAAGVQFVSAETGERGSAGTFYFRPRAPHLLALVYHRLARLLVERTPIEPCEECGRIFVVTDRRQRYCSPQCGNRVRFRRWAKTHRRAAPAAQPDE